MTDPNPIAPALRDLAVPVRSLKPMPGNPRRGDVDAVASSYARFGQRKPIVARRDGTVIAGNHQLLAARKLKWKEIAVVTVDDDDETAAAFALADNRVSDLGGYDDGDLARLLASVADLDGTGYTTDDLNALLADLAAPAGTSPTGSAAPTGPSLAERFVIPPFSVLDARSGPWLDRKRRWLGLGIRSDSGRGLVLMESLSGRIPDYYEQKRTAEARLGRQLSKAEFEADYLVIPEGGGLTSSGTSVFDPVVCELVYRWFSPVDGRVLDPFAGGSVRGIVASRLGRDYVGVELRPEQVTANEEQAAEIVPDRPPRWIAGDSRIVLSDPDLDVRDVDLVFSCPPYADLEVYSDDPADLSNMSWDDFVAAYREIIRAAVDRLAPDRFACFVVGEVREKGNVGAYRNLVGETIRAFVDAGAAYYNEMILVTPTGSWPVRMGRIFPASRKVGKTHQNVLVFVKGDPRRAVAACGTIDVAGLDDLIEAADAVPTP